MVEEDSKSKVSLEDEVEEKVEIYATLDPNRINYQYSDIETPVESMGNSFSLLVDLGRTLSFISPNMVAKLGVNPVATGQMMRAFLENGSEVLMEKNIIGLQFTLQGHASLQRFRVMMMGKF